MLRRGMLRVAARYRENDGEDGPKMRPGDRRLESAEAPAWKPDGRQMRRYGDERRGDNERRAGNSERAPRQGHKPDEDRPGRA